VNQSQKENPMKAVLYCSFKAGDLLTRFRLTLTSAADCAVIVEEAFTDAHGAIGWLLTPETASARIPLSMLAFSLLVLTKMAAGELSIPGASKHQETGVVTADLGTYVTPNMG
jgi:hypothetical protein